MDKNEFLNTQFNKNKNNISLQVNCINNWNNRFSVPVFHYYNLLLQNNLAFKISNIFYNNLPNKIKNIINESNIDKSNINIYFVPQSNQTNIDKKFTGSKNILFRPHYLFIPDKRNGKEGIKKNENIQILSKIGLYNASLPIKSKLNIIENFNKVSGLLVHNNKISTLEPHIEYDNNKLLSVWSLVNDINGNNNEFYITLHWLLPNNIYIELRNNIILNNMTFNLFLKYINKNNYLSEINNSLVKLLN